MPLSIFPKTPQIHIPHPHIHHLHPLHLPPIPIPILILIPIPKSSPTLATHPMIPKRRVNAFALSFFPVHTVHAFPP